MKQEAAIVFDWCLEKSSFAVKCRTTAPRFTICGLRARQCRHAGGELERIQFLLGHVGGRQPRKNLG